jgi:hypothetical protein
LSEEELLTWRMSREELNPRLRRSRVCMIARSGRNNRHTRLSFLEYDRFDVGSGQLNDDSPRSFRDEHLNTLRYSFGHKLLLSGGAGSRPIDRLLDDCTDANTIRASAFERLRAEVSNTSLLLFPSAVTIPVSDVPRETKNNPGRVRLRTAAPDKSDTGERSGERSEEPAATSE